ncbi:MAG: hypothetical protein LBH58_08600 [Tannerellaceae bacterium]|nr:hypothetical protein [Tannerellaceae bacterium]
MRAKRILTRDAWYEVRTAINNREPLFRRRQAIAMFCRIMTLPALYRLNLPHRFLPFVLCTPNSRKVWEENVAQGTSFDMGKEFTGLDFHSVRLKERFIRTTETLYK